MILSVYQPTLPADLIMLVISAVILSLSILALSIVMRYR